MIEITIGDLSEDPLFFAGARIFRHLNVVKYEYDKLDFNAWYITKDDQLTCRADEVAKYFVIDTHFHDAFGHWFFESAIYLPAYLAAKKEIPDLKILLRSKKRYKIDICRYFGISLDDITDTLMPQNICYFPSPITAFNEHAITNQYCQLIIQLRGYFPTPPQNRVYDLIFMPRAKAGNCKDNERIQDTEDIEKNLHANCIYTDSITTFAEQVHIVQCAKHIIISDASAYLVNAFLTTNTKFTVLGNITDLQASRFIKYNFINGQLITTNTVNKVGYEKVGGTFENAVFRFEDIQNYINHSK